MAYGDCVDEDLNSLEQYSKIGWHDARLLLTVTFFIRILFLLTARSLGEPFPKLSDAYYENKDGYGVVDVKAGIT